MEKARGFEVCTKYASCNINLPKRQTQHAVAYDIEAGEDTVIPSIYTLMQNKEDIIPTLIHTGIKSFFMTDEVLYLFNRSGNPIKKGLVLANSVGVIESDYYNNESNER